MPAAANAVPISRRLRHGGSRDRIGLRFEEIAAKFHYTSTTALIPT